MPHDGLVRLDATSPDQGFGRAVQADRRLANPENSTHVRREFDAGGLREE
jgi:hypothetical protein